MKTMSIALVSTALLALSACGGGSKAGNNASTSANSLNTVSEVGNTSTLPPPPADLGTTNSTVGSGNLSGNATVGNTTATGNLSGTATTNTATNSTTK